MFKNLTLIALSMAALLAITPPTVQAEGPLITNALGSPATSITAVSENFTRHTPLGTFECTTAHLAIELTENADTTARGHGAGTAFGDRTKQQHYEQHAAAPCNFANSIFEDVSLTINDIHLTKHGAETTGTATLSYTYRWTNSGGGLTAECTYSGTVPVEAAGSWLTVIAGIAKTGGSAFCLSVLSFTSNFKLFDEFGIPVTIH